MMLAELLTSLGNSPEQIASTLQQHGVKGVRNTVRFLNPIVRFLRAQPNLQTLDCDLILGNVLRVRSPGGSEEHICLPKPILDFLKMFHAGALPHLELDDEEADRAT